jgi:hypothetical protein
MYSSTARCLASRTYLNVSGSQCCTSLPCSPASSGYSCDILRSIGRSCPAWRVVRTFGDRLARNHELRDHCTGCCECIFVGESVRLVDGSNNASSSDPVHKGRCRFTVGMSTRLPLTYHVGRFVIATNVQGNLRNRVRRGSVASGWSHFAGSRIGLDVSVLWSEQYASRCRCNRYAVAIRCMTSCGGRRSYLVDDNRHSIYEPFQESCTMPICHIRGIVHLFYLMGLTNLWMGQFHQVFYRERSFAGTLVLDMVFLAGRSLNLLHVGQQSMCRHFKEWISSKFRLWGMPTLYTSKCLILSSICKISSSMCVVYERLSFK